MMSLMQLVDWLVKWKAVQQVLHIGSHFIPDVGTNVHWNSCIVHMQKHQHSHLAGSVLLPDRLQQCTSASIVCQTLVSEERLYLFYTVLNLIAEHFLNTVC